MARRGLTGDLPFLRTPRRSLGIHIDDTHPSGTLSSERNTAPLDGGTDTTDDPESAQRFERYVRAAQDGTQDDLGGELSQWIPVGFVTAFSLEVRKTEPQRDDKFVNARTWMAEFPADAVGMTDLLIGFDSARYTVQSTSPVIEGDQIVRQRVLLSERVSK